MQVELDRLNGEIEQKQEKIAHIEHSIRLDRLEKEVVELEYISSLVDRFNKVKGEEQKLKMKGFTDWKESLSGLQRN